MKKVILGLSGILVAALVIVLFVNAQKGPDETSKAAKSATEECAGCPSAATCAGMKTETATATATVKCDVATSETKSCAGCAMAAKK